MRLRSPPLTELHALAAVARSGSLTLAANELCVTQSAISRAISRLEEHFGRPLLVRGNRRMELTEAGKNYLDMIGPALEKIEQASSQLQLSSQTRELTLAVAPSFFSNWLVPRLKGFESRHPDIALRFVHYKYEGQDFTGDTPDASINAGMLNAPSINCEYMLGRTMIPICSPSLVKDGKIKTPRDLLSQPLLYHRNVPNSWAIWLKEAGITDVEPALGREFDYVTILIEAVSAGIGVAVVPRCLLDQSLELGKVAAPFNLTAESGRGFYFCYPKAKSDMASLCTFKSWLMEEIAGYSSY
jgi:LysR family transcriptional regulator, glycine cleavage system transcriptional activator